jgi:hypothetical protein
MYRLFFSRVPWAQSEFAAGTFLDDVGNLSLEVLGARSFGNGCLDRFVLGLTHRFR